MVLCASVILVLCTVVSATENRGFMDYLQHGKQLPWEKKNPHHPKWIQMLNWVNIKMKRHNSLYGVNSVKSAKSNDGTSYDVSFWPITDQKQLPTCRAEFFIPLFGRHRDMTVKSYSCVPKTVNKKTIAERTHLSFKGKSKLLTLDKLDN
ncbi:hypothetical protein GE061_006941 [Apolygus lucorum]|uniref:Uncharacterized protein n=1 Tax=Apolygus lucorum TaxID=248454 RepID=A0A6A4J268_APOLU|nr:hypothetical protein GE061_006941 [Apolygus lucorum]